MYNVRVHIKQDCKKTGNADHAADVTELRTNEPRG